MYRFSAQTQELAPLSGKSWIRHCWLVRQFTADFIYTLFFYVGARINNSNANNTDDSTCRRKSTVPSKSPSILFWIQHWIRWGSFPPGVGDPYVSLRYELHDI